jgi:hypothetical protein
VPTLAFKDGNCSWSRVERAELDKLNPRAYVGLASYEQADSFFEQSASPLALEMFGGRVGQIIGPYQVLSALGGGGMGEVYLAQTPGLAVGSR